MGAIRRQNSTRVEYLYQSHTVGRAPSCELVIPRRAISAHHATIRWSEDLWTLRDLGSRNGTFLNGRRLDAAPDFAQPLALGDQLIFAEQDEAWELIDASAPKPLLIPIDEPQTAPLELDGRDVLALPSADDPQVTVFLRQGTWELERDGEVSPLEDKAELRVDGHRYRALITGVLAATTDVKAMLVQRRVKDLMLEIRVSRDEESAALRVQLGAEIHELPQRTFFYLLAFLARHALAEVETRGRDAGWIDVEACCRELGLASSEALGLLVHRCRKAIQGCDLEDPAALIDRSRKGRLRIGIDAGRLSITSVD